MIESKALIKVSSVKTVSKEMDVFYNPVMKFNRDISILLLNSIDKDGLNIADPLAGSGVRSVRFLKFLLVTPNNFWSPASIISCIP